MSGTHDHGHGHHDHAHGHSLSGLTPAEELAVAAHDFLGEYHDRHARRTTAVLLLCAGTMLVELAGGAFFRSMALIADGLHMATHAGVMFVSAAAYRFARARSRDPGFSFGTGKVGDLAAFASACALAATAVFIAIESVGRLIAPVPIAFDEAIVIAIVGLGVNLLSVWLLHDHDHGHDHGHDHHHGHNHHDDHDHDHHNAQVHRDHNIRAAYLHIIADAGVGLAAIVALILARQFGWLWLDPVTGLVGAYVILRWALVLAKAAGSVLLDRVSDPRLAAQVRALAEAHGGRVVDLHLWRVGPGHNALIVAIAGGVHDAGHYRTRLGTLPTLSHITVEVIDAGEAA